MNNIRITFDILEDGKHVKPGMIFLEWYMVFDVIICLTCKARYIANGTKTPDLAKTNYTWVVSRETVRIDLTYLALNGLDIMSVDIQNTYIRALILEKYWNKWRSEFGPDLKGFNAHIVQVLYWCKSVRRDFKNHLRS